LRYTFDVADIDAKLKCRRSDRSRGPWVVAKPGFNQLTLGFCKISVMGEELVGEPLGLSHFPEPVREYLNIPPGTPKKKIPLPP
jgi:hypothetical protein